MKVCVYCGQQNENTATVCSKCGTSEFESSGPTEPQTEAEELLQVVKVFSDAQAADVAAAALRANGIECSIAADDGGGMLLNFQSSEGVRVLVPANRLSDARELLGAGEPGQPQTTIQNLAANLRQRSQPENS
jgi:hypothetical protein